MDSDKKMCPFCGKEISIKAKKCRYCNNWLDEEIECPYCAEKIKASAKKCRFCGEWLPINSEKKESANIFSNFNITSIFSKIQDIKVIISIVLVLFFIFIIIYFAFIKIYPCKSKFIIDNLIQNIQTDFSTIKILNIDKNTIKTVSKNQDGYTCTAAATADADTFNIEYTYKKIGIRNYSFVTKFILPDCYDNSIKQLLIKAIKEQDYLDIKKLVSDIEIQDTSVLNFDKDTPCYKCAAKVYLTAKPGQAFVIDWDYYNADTKVMCDVEFKNLFCGKGYTNCVNISTLKNCKYSGD